MIISNRKEPHLTPDHLFPDAGLPGEWADVKTAYICFTPFPRGFEPYVKEVSTERLFLHSPPSEVRFCRYKDIPFILVSEVYGFAVGTTTVEELIHYGIDTIIAVGYAGAFDGTSMGGKFIATSVMSDLPIGSHYGFKAKERAYPSEGLHRFLTEEASVPSSKWATMAVWNSNSLYREYDTTITAMKNEGCQIVNMDTLALFAAAGLCVNETKKSVEYAYIGTVTDSSGDEDEWDSDLMETIGSDKGTAHDDLVRETVEEIMPLWRSRK